MRHAINLCPPNSLSQTCQDPQNGGEPNCPRLPSTYPWHRLTTERLSVTELFKLYDTQKDSERLRPYHAWTGE